MLRNRYVRVQMEHIEHKIDRAGSVSNRCSSILFLDRYVFSGMVVITLTERTEFEPTIFTERNENENQTS